MPVFVVQRGERWPALVPRGPPGDGWAGEAPLNLYAGRASYERQARETQPWVRQPAERRREVHPKAQEPRSVALPTGHEPTSGRAFPIGDALLAMRWAGSVRDRGYRLSFSHAFRNADEVLEIHLHAYETPIARVHRGHHAIWLTDCLGYSRLFTTLADALLATAPLSAKERRMMLKDRTPSWLCFSGPAVNPKPGTLPRLLRTMMRWLARARKLPLAKAPLRPGLDDLAPL